MKDKIQGYISRLIINGIIVTFIFIALCLNTVAVIYDNLVPEEKKTLNFNGVYIFTSLMESFSGVLLAVGFGLNSEKISEINKLCCDEKTISSQITDIGESSIDIEKLLIK